MPTSTSLVRCETSWTNRCCIRVRRLLAVLAMLLIGSRCPAADLPSPEQLQQFGLEIVWRGQAVLNVQRDVVAHTMNDEDVFYVQSSSGVLTAFHAENGRKMWSVQVGRRDEPAMTAVSNKDLVIVTGGPVLYGFNKFTGAPAVEYRLPRQPMASPFVDEAAIYVPMTEGALYCYSLTRLEYLQRYGTLPEDAATADVWKFICGESIRLPPVAGDQTVALATEAGNLHCIQARGADAGRSGAQVLLTAEISAPMTLAPNRRALDETYSNYSVIALTSDNRVSSIDMVKGTTLWAYPMGQQLLTQPVVIGDDVFVTTEGRQLVKISRDTLSPSWGRPVELPGYSAPSYMGLGLEDATIEPAIDFVSSGGRVREVAEGSPGHMAGVRPGDIIIRVDQISTPTVEEIKTAFAELPLRIQRPLDVVRDGQIVNLSLKVNSDKWIVNGIRSLSAVGRFGVYGVDVSSRLIVIDRESSALQARLAAPGYNYAHTNSVTDYIYLVSNSGDIACLREIGPTMRLPELSLKSRFAKVTKVHVKRGEALVPDETPVVDVELSDGEMQTLTATVRGVVRTVHVSEGQVIEVGQPLILISDDSFATYHQRPDQRPVDVELNSGNSP
ncbi:MAG: PQQ-binding-like beta-propeller repeat protein [Planctomycetaceae bacterium]|nr:PQQ-binding-like beta-propeller repeat protein [Planctomycetaceae bacterium]